MATSEPAAGTRGRFEPAYHETVDAEPEPHNWELIAQTDDFNTLVRERRRFTVVLGALGLGWFALFILLAAYAEGFMAEQIADGLTVAFVLGLSQMLVLWAVIWIYNKRSNSRFMVLQQRAAQVETERRAEADRRSGASARTGARELGTDRGELR